MSRYCTATLTLAVVCWTADPFLFAEPPSQAELRERGQAIYQETCADCHGEAGEGVDGIFDAPLIGDDSIGQLAVYVSGSMPEGSPEDCAGEDAEAVAEYMHYAFYSEAAQIRKRPPRISMTRLTGNQLRQSVSDLYSRFYGLPATVQEFGVSAEYYDGDRWSSKNRKIQRVDPTIDFDFGRESPGDGMKAEAFSIQWTGGVWAKVSGRYELVVNSTCSFVMKFGGGEREFINNYVQSGDKIEFRRKIQLTGGRVYPFEIRFRQRERKTELPPARISLSWVVPGGSEEVIPENSLIAKRVPPAYALQTQLPPDDRSYGYERGISVSREWDESTTAVALEFAQIAHQELWPRYRQEHRKNSNENRAQLKGFLTELVETAFRSSLSDELKRRFVDGQVDLEPDNAEAIKRVCLVALKSPRFLYPTLDPVQPLSQRVANRLALVLFDSLPSDEQLRKLVRAGKLQSEAEVRAFAQRAVDDYRVHTKTREMLMSWVNAEHFAEISKDEQDFPGFDAELVSDLRTSLELFLDQVVWSETSDFRQFFVAKNAFTNQRIAEFYGPAWQPEQAHGQELVSTVESEEHWGLLNHPYLMSGLSYHDSTSPIHRGIFLIRYMLGRTLRPPADAFSPLSPDLHPDLTTRERVALQTSPESCQVCHHKINGLGFTLEPFDAVGRVRAEERGKAVDPTGQYVTRDGLKVEFSGPADLAEFLAESEDSARAFVSRAFQHFVKQPPAAFGTDTLDTLTTRFRENDYSVRKLIVEIAVVATQPTLQAKAAEVAVGQLPE